MKSEEEINTEIKRLQWDIDHAANTKREYCRAYAMIEILNWVLQENNNER